MEKYLIEAEERLFSLKLHCCINKLSSNWPPMRLRWSTWKSQVMKMKCVWDELYSTCTTNWQPYEHFRRGQSKPWSKCGIHRYPISCDDLVTFQYHCKRAGQIFHPCGVLITRGQIYLCDIASPFQKPTFIFLNLSLGLHLRHNYSETRNWIFTRTPILQFALIFSSRSNLQ